MPVIFNPKKINGLFYIPSGATKSESAAFSYSQSSYRVDESNPTPTITGDTGGTFTATPEGLSINSSTGEITLSTSSINSYTVTYTLPSGTFENRSLGIESAAFASTQSFTFDGVDSYFEAGIVGGGHRTAIIRTFSFWIKPVSGTYVPFFCGNANIAAPKFRYAMGAGMVNGRLHFALEYYRASSSYCRAYSELINGTDPTKNIFDGNWHHIAIYNPVDSDSNRANIVNCKMWLDGQPLTVLNDGSPYGTQAIRGLGNAIGLGGGTSGSFSGQEYLNGSMDEFAYWDNTELSSAAVTEIYGTGVPNDLDSLSNASSPTAWYRMGE